MDGTPKLQRKASLSLSTRLNKKRHSASPQNRLKSSTSKGSLNSSELTSNCETLQRSPSVISICSDVGIECTPPHKKPTVNLDESLEFSPKMLDTSFSPTCMLSQTFAIDSPEVGWKWNCNLARGIGGDTKCETDRSSIRTPDSAYAADSSFASAGSSSTEVTGIDCIRGDAYKLRIASDARRNKRKMLEQELRRVEKARAEETLKKRCAKLEEQLKSAEARKSVANQINEDNSKQNCKISESSLLESVKSKIQSTAATSANAKSKISPSVKLKRPELLNDFFNDSDSDSFLLEATQEIESKIEVKTQPSLANFTSTMQKSSNSVESVFVPYVKSFASVNSTTSTTEAAAPVTNSSSNIENKRSSFYMKFLEDDCPDDWFVSLDEVIIQATQNKKPRNSLQRYRSMPADTATNCNVALTKQDNSLNLKTNSRDILEDDVASSSTASKIKRHSSVHDLNPVRTNFQSGRQF